jgi:hypothetical protein
VSLTPESTNQATTQPCALALACLPPGRAASSADAARNDMNSGVDLPA